MVFGLSLREPRLPLGGPKHVPRDLFQPVAEVLAYVYRTLGKLKR